MQTTGNQVTTYKTVSTLTAFECSVIEAIEKSPMIVHISKYDLARHVNTIIQRAYYESGISVKGDNDEDKTLHIVTLAKSVADDLKKKHKTLTIKEFEIAVENGIRKEYGDYHGLNVATFHMFAKEFKKSAEREEALRKLKIMHEEPEVRPSDDEINKFMNEACIRSFSEYKASGKLTDLGGAKFQHLEKIGIIQMSNEQKAAIFKEAKQIILENATKTIFSQSGQTTAKVIAHEIIKNPDKHEAVKNHAREMALKVFFDQLISQNTELKNLIS